MRLLRLCRVLVSGCVLLIAILGLLAQSLTARVVAQAPALPPHQDRPTLTLAPSATPVPTATESLRPTITQAPTEPIRPSLTPQPTSTFPPTNTPFPEIEEPTVTPSSTPTPQPTSLLWPSPTAGLPPTPRPSATPIPPPTSSPTPQPPPAPPARRPVVRAATPTAEPPAPTEGPTPSPVPSVTPQPGAPVVVHLDDNPDGGTTVISCGAWTIEVPGEALPSDSSIHCTPLRGEAIFAAPPEGFNLLGDPILVTVSDAAGRIATASTPISFCYTYTDDELKTAGVDPAMLAIYIAASGAPWSAAQTTVKDGQICTLQDQLAFFGLFAPQPPASLLDRILSYWMYILAVLIFLLAVAIVLLKRRRKKPEEEEELEEDLEEAPI